MQNDAGEYVDMYIPRKCSASNKLISAKDHASVQINVATAEDGKLCNKSKVYAISGYIRRMGESDDSLNRLMAKDGLFGEDITSVDEEDVMMILAAKGHIGTTNLNHQMKPYVYKRTKEGMNVIDIRKMLQKINIAARVIAAIEERSDVCVISSRPAGQRAVLKFAHFTGANAIAGRFTPGTFTNQTQKSFAEPRLLVVTDPWSDHQAVIEASYVNIPVIALCNADSPMRFIDVVVPCNNKCDMSVGLVWWLLAREVLRLRGVLSRSVQWEVMPDLFFQRKAEEVAKEEQVQAEVAAPVQEEYVPPAVEYVPEPVAEQDQWNVQPTADWGEPQEAWGN